MIWAFSLAYVGFMRDVMRSQGAERISPVLPIEIDWTNSGGASCSPWHNRFWARLI